MDCNGVGIGVQINQETGDVGIFLSLHEEDGGPPSAQIVLPLERAGQIMSAFMARLLEAKSVENEIASHPPEQRMEAVRLILDRMTSGLN